MTQDLDESYNDLLQDVINKSEDHFEKKITYITAGALVLTLTLIEKVIKFSESKAIFFLVIGWVFLTMTLLLNLVSHLVSKMFINETRKDITREMSKERRIELIRKRNRKIEIINWICVVLLVFGIAFIVIFASINATCQANK